MSDHFKLYSEPFHVMNFVSFQNKEELLHLLQAQQGDKNYILSLGEKENVDFAYFVKFAPKDFCLSLGFENNQGQIFYSLEQNKIVRQSRGNHIHDGLTLGNLLKFDLKNLSILRQFFSTQELIGFQAIVCPQKTGKIKALFLDRDGIINIDKGYVFRKEDLEFSPGILGFLQHAQSLSYDLHVLTNQSGVARGYYGEEDVKKLHFYMNEELKRAGIYIRTWSYCLYHEEATILEYKKESMLRKPDPGMLLALTNHFAFDFDQSLMIGDKKSDILNLLGLRTILLQGKYPLENAPCKVVKNLEELTLLI